MTLFKNTTKIELDSNFIITPENIVAFIKENNSRGKWIETILVTKEQLDKLSDVIFKNKFYGVKFELKKEIDSELKAFFK